MRFKVFFLLSVFFLALAGNVLAAEPLQETPDVITILGVVAGSSVNLRSEPRSDSQIVTVLQNNTPVAITEIQDLWLKVRLEDGSEGWIFRSYVKTMKEGESAQSEAEAIISCARRYMGSRYRYGGISAQGFDCSGFTQFVFGQFGIKLPHNAAAQTQYGVVVEKSQLRQGDLVFFSTLGAKYINHVGIYIGGDQFIHAPFGYGAVRISPLDEGYYLNCYRTARRALHEEPGAIQDGSPTVTNQN